MQCLSNPLQHVPIYLQQFPSYSNHKCKKSPFLRTVAHIFVSHRDVPATKMQNAAWMERQFNACQTPRGLIIIIINNSIYPAVSKASRTGNKVSCQPNDCPNRWVFKRGLKMASDGAETMSVGRQVVPDAWCARSPIIHSRVRRTSSFCVVADCSRLRESSVSAHCRSRCSLVATAEHKNGQTKLDAFRDAQPCTYLSSIVSELYNA